VDSEIPDSQTRLLEATKRLQEVLLAGSGRDNTSAELHALRAKVSDLEEQLHETRHRLLTSQDSLVGSEAEIVRLRRKFEAEIEQRIFEMKSSASWRIGNTVVRQLRWLRHFGTKR
jgi:septal ring factor EnvC (AmiA/AmiB activator)